MANSCLASTLCWIRCHLTREKADADFVLTGEGRIDDQTAEGKAIAGIVRRAGNAGVPVLAFAGSVRPGYERMQEWGRLSVHNITPSSCTFEEALRAGKLNLANSVEITLRSLHPNMK
ncbi:glycerate kinase [Paenibacillus sp. MSJ-34]|uniref:glycerate kinase n=1 Tax=Paenibacillus sp. MSJ-34 TaxID=2841529 RepID=UPI0034611F94